MKNTEQLQEIINREIGNIAVNERPEELYEPIRYILSGGGKRLRPLLLLSACQLFNDPIDDAIKPAIGIEVFHNFTLVHDDIMDHADMRRSRPTVHAKWDINRAILSGDAMQLLAYECFFGLKPDMLAKVLPVFTKTAIEVCEGQQYDMNFETHFNVSITEYMQMIRLKTAVLIAGALKIGAILGHASEADSNNLYDIGISMGLGFQLMDDYLDVYGDPEIFGKNIGGDIVSNKKTFLLIEALHRAGTSDHNQLMQLLTDRYIEPAVKIEKVVALYDKLGIKDLCLKKIADYHNDAVNQLAEINVPGDRKKILLNLLEKLSVRTN